MHLFSKALVGAGVAMFLAASVWHPLVVPKLVKLPDNVDRTDVYSGTFVTFIDQATGATLASPIEVPLTVERHVFTEPGGTTAKVSLLHQTITAHMGDRTQVQQDVFAVDRRTMENVTNPKAWTFVPENVVDRSGTYYLTLPMSLKSTGERFPMWKAEAGASYTVSSATPATGKAGGANVVYLKGSVPTLPAATYETAALKAQGLPMALTPDQSAATLAAAGVDAVALAPVLVGALTGEEMQTVLAALAAPVPLNYFVYGSGTVGAERKTGGLVVLDGIVDGISVKPDMSAMAPAVAALSNHKDVPAIASLLTTLNTVATAPPQPVFELRYTQTPDSVNSAGSYANSQADKITMATVTIPRVLIAAGIVFLLAGIVVMVLQRRRPQPPEPVVDETVHEPRVPVGSGV